MSIPTADLSPAISRYMAFLAQDPDNPLLLTTLADMLHHAGHFDLAIEHYRRCIHAHPQNRVALCGIGNVQISQHRFEDAVQSLHGAINPGAPDAALLHNLGLALVHLKRWPEALEALRKAAECGLVLADNVRLRACALHALGKIDEAIGLCEQWLTNSPADIAMRAHVALLEMDSGDMNKAHARAAAVLRIDPGNADAALVEGMWLTEQQRADEAASHFERVLARQPEQPRAWLGMGLSHLHRGQHAQAIDALQKALEFTPGAVGTLVTLGWAYFAQRDLQQAEATFRAAVTSDRRFGEAHGGLAVSLLFQRRVEEARRSAEVARRLNPQGFGALWVRSALLSLRGQRAQGEAEVAAALSRPFTADGRSLFDHIQRFTREQRARSDPPSRAVAPPPAPPDT